jgi:phosphoadenosine phosphosulfate reductase
MEPKMSPPENIHPHRRDTAIGLASRLSTIHTLEGRLAEIVRSLSGKVAFSTSFGLEDQAILHAIASQTGANLDIFTLDTGRLFPETLETLAESEQRYRLRIRVVVPEADHIERLVGRDGVFGFRVSIDARKACCEVRKVRPLARALHGAAAWITGLRRGQSSGRGEIPFAAWDGDHALIKVNPLADWSLERLEDYIGANGVPINPLHARGFPSIGCQPCTRAVRPGEDVRAGRWWWENEDGKECGLHNRPIAPVGASA